MRCRSEPFGAAIHLLETHISWVLLTGLYAYKIKKPVNVGFLDHQIATQDPLGPDEDAFLLCVQTKRPSALAQIISTLHRMRDA